MTSLVLTGKDHDLGGFSVRRILPARERRMVGPFIFFDFIGPATIAGAVNSDVRPHPHIGLATVTFLFDGALLHRDSLGSEQVIRPGEVNWMTAGRGIVHSERTVDEERGRERKLHGIQLWVALPLAHEEAAPSFTHHAAAALPLVATSGGAQVRLLAGEALGARAPAPTLSPLFYADVRLERGARLDLAALAYPERAAFLVDGAARVVGAAGATSLAMHTMAVLADDAGALEAGDAGARLMLLGGAPLDGPPRHAFWNFVSSSRERIEQAKADWRERRFGVIPGDDEERIPLPEP